jgi:hypothetical protein
MNSTMLSQVLPYMVGFAQWLSVWTYGQLHHACNVTHSIVNMKLQAAQRLLTLAPCAAASVCVRRV